jgi:soluble lytic murein transglycosylase-like protein
VRFKIDRRVARLSLAALATLHALVLAGGALVAMRPRETAAPAPIALAAAPPPPALPLPLPPLVPYMRAAYTAAIAPAASSAPRRLSFRTAPRRASAFALLIDAAAREHDLPPLLVAAIARVESDFDPYEVSHKGARGLLQVMPETGARFGVRPAMLFDPERNLAAGTAYLAWLLARYDGNLDLALAAYNAGEGAVDNYRGIPPYRETQNYVRKVRAELRSLESRAALE